MNDELFNGSLLKIKWAKHHIDNLNSVVIDYLNTHAFTPEVNRDSPIDGYRINFRAVTSEPIPWNVPLIIGDAIHGIRSALDIMVCDMVKLQGGTPDKWTRLPFSTDRQQLIGTLNGGKIKLYPAIYDFILNIIKPYDPCNGGNDALWSLHYLNIEDKHELIIPVVAEVQTDRLHGTIIGGRVVFNEINFSLTGGQFNSIQTPGISGPDVKIANHGQAFFQIAFDKGQPFEYDPVIPTLYNLADVVVGVIEAAALVVGKSSN